MPTRFQFRVLCSSLFAIGHVGVGPLAEVRVCGFELVLGYLSPFVRRVGCSCGIYAAHVFMRVFMLMLCRCVRFSSGSARSECGFTNAGRFPIASLR